MNTFYTNKSGFTTNCNCRGYDIVWLAGTNISKENNVSLFLQDYVPGYKAKTRIRTWRPQHKSLLPRKPQVTGLTIVRFQFSFGLRIHIGKPFAAKTIQHLNVAYIVYNSEHTSVRDHSFSNSTVEFPNHPLFFFFGIFLRTFDILFVSKQRFGLLLIWRSVDPKA
jgi:hypothetical protein